MEKIQALKYLKKKVIIQTRGSERSERFYAIVINCHDEFMECINARDQLMTFAYSAIEMIYPMSPRQQERFDLIRHGKAGIQHDIHNW